MKTALRRHLTLGNALALTALMVALGGTAVAASTLANGSVTSAKLANSAVTSAKIANSAVKSAKIANGSITSSKIANSAVTSAKIANSAVTSAKIANSAVTAAKIAPGTLGGVSAAKVTIVTGTPVTVPAFSTGTTATATCPAGQRAISGGFNVGSLAIADATGPTADGLGWSVTAEAIDVPAPIFATVVCAAP
jgi:hypothetical protein